MTAAREVTAETLTDAEIREEMWATMEDETPEGDAKYRDCRVALGGGLVRLIGQSEEPPSDSDRGRARARIATAINARKGK